MERRQIERKGTKEGIDRKERGIGRIRGRTEGGHSGKEWLM